MNHEVTCQVPSPNLCHVAYHFWRLSCTSRMYFLHRDSKLSVTLSSTFASYRHLHRHPLFPRRDHPLTESSAPGSGKGKKSNHEFDYHLAVTLMSRLLLLQWRSDERGMSEKQSRRNMLSSDRTRVASRRVQHYCCTTYKLA